MGVYYCTNYCVDERCFKACKAGSDTQHVTIKYMCIVCVCFFFYFDAMDKCAFLWKLYTHQRDNEKKNVSFRLKLCYIVAMYERRQSRIWKRRKKVGKTEKHTFVRIFIYCWEDFLNRILCSQWCAQSLCG